VTAPVLLIGVGNRYRRDDGAGLELVRRLKDGLGAGVDAVESDGAAASLMEVWRGRTNVFLFDAVKSGASPGTIHRLDPGAEAIRAGHFRCSTHDFGVAEAVELSRAFGDLPEKFFIYGIEGKVFDEGEGLSSESESAVQELAAELMHSLARFIGNSSVAR